jgi:hypothetical protein
VFARGYTQRVEAEIVVVDTLSWPDKKKKKKEKARPNIWH